MTMFRPPRLPALILLLAAMLLPSAALAQDPVPWVGSTADPIRVGDTMQVGPVAIGIAGVTVDPPDIPAPVHTLHVVVIDLNIYRTGGRRGGDPPQLVWWLFDTAKREIVSTAACPDFTAPRPETLDPEFHADAQICLVMNAAPETPLNLVVYIPTQAPLMWGPAVFALPEPTMPEGTPSPVASPAR